MALDWGILHWIQNNITCPFLDAVMQAFTCFGEELAFVGGPGVEAEARWGRVGPAQALALQAGALRVGQAQAADAVAVGRAPAVVSPALVRHGAGSARWAGPSRRRASSCG